jgi:hypothetical protein
MHSLNDAGFPLVRGSVWAVVALAIGVFGPACAKKPVVVIAEPPPLAIPVVPPRLVGPVQVAEEAPPPVEDTPEPAPRTTPRAPRVTRGATDAPPARPADPAGTDAPKPEPVEGPPASGENPPSLLRTVETADDREASRRVKEILGRAESNLAKVNYKSLSNTARMQHDQVTRFIAQAEDALRVRSFTFARELANKAEVLSGSLVNR